MRYWRYSSVGVNNLFTAVSGGVISASQCKLPSLERLVSACGSRGVLWKRCCAADSRVLGEGAKTGCGTSMLTLQVGVMPQLLKNLYVSVKVRPSSLQLTV